MEFPPDSSFGRLSQVSNVNPERRAIDEQMDRFICDESSEPMVLELLEAPGKGRVIGDREAQSQEVGQ